MGALEGSLTYRTFFVDGEPPKNFRDDYLERIKRLAFRELSPELEDDRSIGWVCIEHPLDVDFQRAKVFFNEYLCLGLRIDRWSIPSLVLKAHLRDATQRYLAKTGAESLGRREKEDLKAEVVRQLKHRLMPSMKVVDMAWNLNTGHLRFWSHGGTLGEEFMGVFEDTFALRIVPDSPYTAAVELGLDDDALARLAEIEPQPFVDLQL